MRKILKRSQPIITSYPKFGNIISILSDHPYFFNWLYLNHIQLQGDFNPDIFWVDFYQPLSRKHYPLIERQGLRRKSIINNNIAINDFIMKSLDEDSYIYIYVDTFYISAYKNNYQKTHFPHDLFIYGYDSERKIYFISDFFDGPYSVAETSFKEFETAFLSPDLSSYPEFMDIQLLNVLNDEKFLFDKEQCIQLLSDYLNSENTSKKYSTIENPLNDSNYFFGVGIYKPLQEFVLQSSNHYQVARALHVLYDHKKLMRHRVAFLLQTNHLNKSQLPLIDIFIDLEEQALAIRNLYLKYSVNNDEILIERVLGLITTLKELEEKNIELLISSLI